jgi:hypothetical protein
LAQRSAVQSSPDKATGYPVSRLEQEKMDSDPATILEHDMI